MIIVSKVCRIAKFVALMHVAMPQVRGDAVSGINGTSAIIFYLFILAC